MEKNKVKGALRLKNTSFYNRSEQDLNGDTSTADIRLGISIADEKARQESNKRRNEAPLSIEEKLFLGKL